MDKTKVSKAYKKIEEILSELSSHETEEVLKNVLFPLLRDD